MTTPKTKTRKRRTPARPRPEDERGVHVRRDWLLRNWDRRVSVAVIGCGGTGSVVAGLLAWLDKALRTDQRGYLDVTLFDAGVVRPANLVRQPYSANEIGRPKSVVLADRLNSYHGTRWEAVPSMVTRKTTFRDLGMPRLVISCVDTRAARAEVARVLEDAGEPLYWLDFGNGVREGQYVLGEVYPSRSRYYGRTLPKDRLPTVAELFPQAVDPALDSPDDGPSCSAAEALASQGPFANQSVAVPGLSLLEVLLRQDEIHHHGAFIDAAHGYSTPLLIQPRLWARERRKREKARLLAETQTTPLPKAA